MEAQAADTGLHKVRGPSALSGGWGRFTRLSWHLARTDFYLRYHGYAQFFPLWALARYRNLRAANTTSVLAGM